MLLLFNHQLASLIFLLNQEINALQSLGLELVYQVVQGLEASDGDHAAVVWWVGNLHSKAEHSDQEYRQLCCAHERVVAWWIRWFICNLLQDPEHSFNKTTNYINFVHDIANYWVFSGQLKLILLERGVQREEVSVECVHILINNLILEWHDSLIYFNICISVVYSEHDLNQHESTLNYISTIWQLLARSCQITDLFQYVIKIVHEGLL